MASTEADANDAADMEALRAGSDQALNKLMERHREAVYRFLIRMVQDETEALDLAQECFVRVYVNRAKFNPRHRFGAWLFTIAANLARDRIRWLGRHPTVSLDSSPSPGSQKDDRTLADTLAEGRMGPTERLEQSERLEQIKKALAEIPEELRAPLILAEYEDLPQSEIAEILNCTTKAVENRIYRARKILREKLAHLASGL